VENEEKEIKVAEEKEHISNKEEKIKEIDLLTERIKELEDKLLRNHAEFVNYRRRKEEEMTQFLKYANTELVKSFLPILDNFERAIKMDDNDLTDEVSKFLNGFKMTYDELKRTLNNFDVLEIDALDKPFDPNFHDAVATEENKDKQHGVVLDVLQKGYMLNDRVIRPAMVKVNENNKEIERNDKNE